MLQKLLIRTWFGPLPPWTDQFLEHVKPLAQYGWHFRLVTDFPAYQGLVERRLGVRPTDTAPGTRKCGDWDPMIGEIFAEDLIGFDFWGHCNLDAVYGRIDKWLPDGRLAELDVFGNDPNAICGPFSVYRNVPYVNGLFRRYGDWQSVFGPHYYGFDEAEFTEIVRQARDVGAIRFQSGFYQAHDKMPQHLPRPKLKRMPDGTLLDLGVRPMVPIMMFHFNRKDIERQWPLSASS